VAVAALGILSMAIVVGGSVSAASAHPRPQIAKQRSPWRTCSRHCPFVIHQLPPSPVADIAGGAGAIAACRSMATFETDLTHKTFKRTQAWLQAGSVLTWADLSHRTNSSVWTQFFDDATNLVNTTGSPSEWKSNDADAQLPAVRTMESDCMAVDSGHVP